MGSFRKLLIDRGGSYLAKKITTVTINGARKIAYNNVPGSSALKIGAAVAAGLIAGTYGAEQIDMRIRKNVLPEESAARERRRLRNRQK